LSSWRYAALQATPAGVVGAVVWALAWREQGSFAGVDWLGYCALVLVVLATLLASGAVRALDRLAVAGIACLLALAAWNAVSLTWSPTPALAREEALLVAFYAAVLALPLLSLRGELARLAASGVLVAALGSLALVTALKLRSFGGDPREIYTEGRLAFPVTYANGEAALLLIGVWPAVALAARRTLAVPLRAVALGVAVLEAALFIAPQSKGALLGLIASSIALFAVAPNRLRLVVPAAVAVGLAGAGWTTISEPYRLRQDAGFLAAIHHAAGTVLVLAAVGTAVGALYALADRRIAVPPRLERILGLAAAGAVAAALAGGIAAFFVTVDHPRSFVSERWDDFKHYRGEGGTTHLLTFGSNRYDFWRVAADEFEDNPVAGIGARGFAADYLLHRRSPEYPRRAHSLELDVLGETGIVGFGLLLGGLACPFVLAVKAARRSATAAAALAAATGWLVHATVDWIWTLPAVALPFFLLLGIGGARDGPLIRRRRLAAGAAGIVVLATALAVVPPWIAARLTNQGRYGAARSWDPLTTDPYVAEALSSRPYAIAPLRRAADKEPRRYVLHYFLARAYKQHGRDRDARREAAIALRLDPHDAVLRRALRRAQIVP
jgi:O-antigen ligase